MKIVKLPYLYKKSSILVKFRWLSSSHMHVSHETVSSSAECSRDKSPFSFVRGQDSTMWAVEEPKQLADEASRFHLGCQRQHSVVICSGTLLFSSRVLCPSLVTLCLHKSGRCAVELYHASHLWYPPFYTSPMAFSALQH